MWTAKQENGGYEYVRGNRKIDGEWINTPKIPVHRLCALAWFGQDAIADRDVHHRISIPWLNVESNLLPITHPEHGMLGGEKEYGMDAVIEDVLEGMGDE